MISPSRISLLAIPNFSDGTRGSVIAAIADRLESVPGIRLLDTHSDSDHDRTVYTLAGAQVKLAEALVRGAAVAVDSIDLRRQGGLHPRVGALDVAPIVYLDQEVRGRACAEALTLADRLADELALPVFIYGELSGERHVTRADLRRGGPQELQRRIDSGELTPDFGPSQLHRGAGAVLVAARPPLIAFNVELAPPAGLEDARRIAALIREGGEEGLAGVRAIGLRLAGQGGVAQVSTNIEDFGKTSPRRLLGAIARHARPLRAELIGLAPRAAFQDFPAEIEVANLRYVEDALEQPALSVDERLSSSIRDGSDQT